MKYKRAKMERKSVREAKLVRLKAKNDRLIKNNSGNRSKDNLEELQIPLTDESPYILKLEAYEKVSSLQGEDSRFGRIADLMDQSFDEKLWLDYFRILSPGVFNYDMYAARDVKVMIDHQKTSPLPAEDLEYVLFKLVQADKMLAYTGIQDTKNFIERMPEDQSIEFEQHLDKAIERFSIAEEELEAGSYISAIQQYNNAWNESSGYLIRYGALQPPQISIETQASDSYVNSSSQRASGTVLDPMLAQMTSVNITVDGKTSAVPLINGTFETEVTLKEGLNTIEAGAINYFGNEGTERINVTLDTIPPDIGLTGIEDGAYYTHDVYAEVGISDLHLNTSSVLLDGKPYASGMNISSEGRHTLAARAIDLAGNSAYRTANFTIDRAPPDVRIFYPGDAAFVRQTVNIQGKVSDLDLDAVPLKIDGLKVSGSADYDWDTRGYSEGYHTVTIEARDRVGNTASASVGVIVDNTMPDVIIKSPLNFYQRGNITVDADVIESNLYSISVRIDGRKLSSALPYHLNTALYPDGDHTIEIYASDKAGNTNAMGAKFNFDNAAPWIIITSPPNASFVSGAVVIEGAVKDANLLASMVTVDGRAVYDTLPYLWNTFAYDNGNHTIRIDAADNAGNRASKEIIVTVDNA